MLARNFSDVDAVLLHRLYTLFFVELGTRHVYVCGITVNRVGEWVTQQAGNLSMTLAEEGLSTKFPIRDGDAEFTAKFDEVLWIWRHPDHQYADLGSSGDMSSPNVSSAPCEESTWTGCSSSSTHSSRWSWLSSSLTRTAIAPSPLARSVAPKGANSKPLQFSDPNQGQLRRDDTLGGTHPGVPARGLT
jgi:hypothetical protein